MGSILPGCPADPKHHWHDKNPIKTTRTQRGARTSGCYCLTCCLRAPGKLVGCPAGLFLTPPRIKEPALLSRSSACQRRALQQTSAACRNTSKSWCGRKEPTASVTLWQGAAWDGSRRRRKRRKPHVPRNRGAQAASPAKKTTASEGKKNNKPTRGQSFKIHLGKLTFHFHLTQRYGRALGHSS